MYSSAFSLSAFPAIELGDRRRGRRSSSSVDLALRLSLCLSRQGRVGGRHGPRSRTRARPRTVLPSDQQRAQPDARELRRNRVPLPAFPPQGRVPVVFDGVVRPPAQKPRNRGPAVAVDAVGGDDDGVFPGGEGGFFHVGVELV